ncbi:thioesterase family protein [Marinobacter sp. 2_MG-2023]|uniref:acyl-CoA thioesterase n=1 Tax=Marinobacter sp. 2_MG-2023 TaxID=3062679 RepID=UPI0026E41F34|nr:thioesterase family protein [Marinobacter sp. 2_MG-2023]MDO6440672.1 thioesterase family protein [Marinobacter sp. 2_MG-2023]
MFYYELQPRFSDTDALGHISNTTLPVWFEQARMPLFSIFHPTLDLKTWPLIIARVEIDFVAQSYWHLPVEIRTGVGKIGNSSFQAVQEAWQDGKQIARGQAVLIHFDYGTDKAVPIPEEIRNQLANHRIE